MDLPLVSIVTPCLNPGPRLERCLKSVAGQTYSPIEHIVIDGGSTDGTLELLGGSPGIRWVSEPDASQAAAINKGLEMAGGEIVSWLNADDDLKPWATDKAVSVLQRGEWGWAYGNIEIMDGNAMRLWTPSSTPDKDLFGLGKGGVIPQPGTFIKAEAVRRVGGLDESFELAMDFDLWLRLMDAGIRPVYIPETLAVFAIHADSKTGRMGLGRFCTEEARAFEKLGRVDLASLALGRAAAHQGGAGNGIRPKKLRREVFEVCRSLPGTPSRKAVQRVRAAAKTEAALVGLRRSMAGAVRHLLSPDPWLVKETRARLLAAASEATKRPPSLFHR